MDDAASSEIYDRLLTLARERDMDGLEAAWMENLESERPDCDALLRVGRYLVGRKLNDHAGLLLWALVEALAERAGAEAALSTAKRAVLVAPGDRQLREQLVGLFRKSYPDLDHLEALLEPVAGAPAADVPSALDRLERLLRFRPGAYVVHQRSRRVGRVRGFENGKFIIEAEGSTYRHDPAALLEEWEPLPPDDFRALASFEADRLRRLAQDDPEGLARLILRTFGGVVEFRQFKAALVPAIIEAGGWTRWWSTARDALKRSAWIGVSSGPQPRLSLRERPADFTSQLLERADAAQTPADEAAVVMELLKEAARDPDAWRETALALAGRYLRKAQQRTGPDKALLLSALVVMRGRFPAVPDVSRELLEEIGESDLAGLIRVLPGDDAARLLLDALKDVGGERWVEWYAEAFPACSLRLCDFIHRELVRAGEEALFLTAAEQTVAEPEASPLALAWTWRHLLGGGEALRKRLEPVSVTVVLLHLMHRIERMPRHAPGRADARQALSKIRAIVAANDAALLRAMIERADARDAQRLHEALTAGDGLAGEVRHRLLEALRERHPGLFAEKRPLWEDGYVYMTAEGLSRMQAALAKLVNEDMRRNAVAIGAAAAKGDLRENWEYKAALEERDRLVERAGRLRETLDRARVIPRGEVTAERVTVGARVRLRDQTGAQRAVTFLGPPDADVERGVFSYLAPLSLRFMGKRKGDRVVADLGGGEMTWEIISIEAAV